jgi:RNA polymerase sigma-70 factor (ECF subfamily)
VRRQGQSPENAQYLTQDFFAHLLARRFPRGATPERGKFHSFPLVSLRQFLLDQHRRADAAKRGGRQAVISLNVHRAPIRLGVGPQNALTPEKLKTARNCKTDWERTGGRRGNGRTSGRTITLRVKIPSR